MKRHPLPSFGYWDYCDELLSAHYFESAVQAGVIRGHYFGEDGDLFYHRKVIKKVGNAGGEKQQHGKEQQRKQVKVSDMKLQTTPRRPRALKAVDEDLYKIPPELLYQKPKRKRSIRKLWSGCMGINNVA